MLGGLGGEPEGLINETYQQEQRLRQRQRARTLSARGDNQHGARSGTRWSALHLVHSTGSHTVARGPPEAARDGNAACRKHTTSWLSNSCNYF